MGKRGEKAFAGRAGKIRVFPPHSFLRNFQTRPGAVPLPGLETRDSPDFAKSEE